MEQLISTNRKVKLNGKIKEKPNIVYIHTRVIKVHMNTNAMLLSRSWKLTDRNHGCYHSKSP